jgi:hypothetical protein
MDSAVRVLVLQFKSHSPLLHFLLTI